MTVFVESNFVLELAFEQAHQAFCQRIVRAAEAELLTLVVPQYALTEVFQTLGRRRAERAGLRNALTSEMEQHQREASVDLPEMDRLAQLLNNLLITRTLSQKAHLFAVAARLAQLAPGPALTAAIITDAARQEQAHSLTPQDALVYASVMAGLRELPVSAPKLFITRNRRDFDKKALVAELRKQGCDILFDFQAAVGKLNV